MWSKIIAWSILLCGIVSAQSVHGIYKEEKELKRDSHTQGSEKEGAKEDSKESQKEQHIFREDIYTTHNPLFSHAAKEPRLSYGGALGLSDSQTLIFNGGAIAYTHPLQWNQFQVIGFANLTLGNTLITTQAQQKNAFFFGTQTGFDASMPLSLQGVVAHLVFGADIGFGVLMNQATILPIQTYCGTDFLYERYVFRPFVSLSGIMPFGNSSHLTLAATTDIGLETLYRGDTMRLHTRVGISYLFSGNTADIFAMLPNAMPLYMGQSALRFDLRAGAQYTITYNLNVGAEAFVLYTSSYNALSVNGQIRIGYILK